MQGFASGTQFLLEIGGSFMDTLIGIAGQLPDQFSGNLDDLALYRRQQVFELFQALLQPFKIEEFTEQVAAVGLAVLI